MVNEPAENDLSLSALIAVLLKRGIIINSKRVLGIDYGEARTGFAVSDPLGIMACGLETVRSGKPEMLAGLIAEYAEKYDAGVIVIGNPVNMNGTAGPRSEKAAELAAMVERMSGRHVVLFDERCTTMLAHKIMNETDTRGKKRKKNVDTLSAEIILQNYMDSVKNRKNTGA